MPYQTQTEKNVAYIDIRIHFDRETETFTDEEGNVEEIYTAYDISKVSRKKLKGVTEEEAESFGESFAQMDAYQTFFCNEVPQVVSDGLTREFE